MGISAWLLTGMVILGPDQRAVYERFGAPVAVSQPGVHVALPWVRRRRPIDSRRRTYARAGEPPVDVEHPGATSQSIAGASGDRQNFQIVSADVRLDCGIGLSDAAARAALYRGADVLGTVRAIANRAVVRYHGPHALVSVLGTRQTVVADGVGVPCRRSSMGCCRAGLTWSRW